MIQTIFVAGAGLMGRGIAQVVITAGRSVLLYDVSNSVLDTARVQIQSSLEKLAAKGRLTESVEPILGRLTMTTDLTDVRAADLVIEAVPEQESLKRELFSRFDQLVSPGTLLTSNTSAIPITTLAAATRRPERFCGLHFFNPVPLMSLVEVVQGEKTSEETLAAIQHFAEEIGKQPVVVRGEQPGFIVNRILGAAMIEAIRILEAGHASAADIDQAMRLGCGWKMGPLETADLAGLDVVMQMCDVMQTGGNTDQVFHVSESLRARVAAGQLGRKSGQGFYDYPKPVPYKHRS